MASVQCALSPPIVTILPLFGRSVKSYSVGPVRSRTPAFRPVVLWRLLSSGSGAIHLRPLVRDISALIPIT